MKLEPGKAYRMEYSGDDFESGRHNHETFTHAVYEGIETECAGMGIECARCGQAINSKAHQFNIPENEADPAGSFARLAYETRYFGSACIKTVKWEGVK